MSALSHLPPTLLPRMAPEPMHAGIKSLNTVHESHLDTYLPRSIASIYIPVNENTYILGDQCYLSGDFTPDFVTDVGGVVSVDSSFNSLIDSVNLYHGSVKVCGIDNYGANTNAIRDHSGGNSGVGDSTLLGTSAADNTKGVSLTTDKRYPFAFNLASMPVIGGGSEHSLALGWLGGRLRLEIQFSSAAGCMNTIGGDATTAITSFLIENLKFNMASTVVPREVDAAIRQAYGAVPVFHATSMSSDTVPFNGKRVNPILGSMSKISLRNFFWYMQPTATTTSTVTGDNYPRSKGQRTWPDGDVAFLTAGGNTYPESRITCISTAADIYPIRPSECMINLQRALGTSGSATNHSSISATSYCNNTQTPSVAVATRGGFLGAIPLSRGNEHGTEMLPGIDTSRDTVRFDCTLKTAVTAAHELNVFNQYDALLFIKDGQLSMQS
jgi:hypothetical protein